MQSAVLPSIVTLSGVERVSIGTLSAYILSLSGDIVLFKVHRVESGMFGAKLSSRIVQQSLLNRVCGTKNYENMFLSPISHDPPRSIGLHRTSTVIVGSQLKETGRQFAISRRSPFFGRSVIMALLQETSREPDRIELLKTDKISFLRAGHKNL